MSRNFQRDLFKPCMFYMKHIRWKQTHFPSALLISKMTSEFFPPCGNLRMLSKKVSEQNITDCQRFLTLWSVCIQVQKLNGNNWASTVKFETKEHKKVSLSFVWILESERLEQFGLQWIKRTMRYCVQFEFHAIYVAWVSNWMHK